jgi:hypothetical protein
MILSSTGFPSERQCSDVELIKNGHWLIKHSPPYNYLKAQLTISRTACTRPHSNFALDKLDECVRGWHSLKPYLFTHSSLPQFGSS